MSVDSVSFPDIAPMYDRGYKTIMADPPWAYDDSLDGDWRGAESHYDTLSTDMIAAMGHQVNTVAANHAHLYLWTTNAFMEDAYRVCDSWGFDSKTIVTWVKTTQDGTPVGLPHERQQPSDVKERIGMGHYLRNTTEHMIFATKGRKNTNSNSVPTHFFAERTEHSSKPEKAYRLVEQLSDGPRLEIFARSNRTRWDTWGDETPAESRPRNGSIEPRGDEV